MAVVFVDKSVRAYLRCEEFQRFWEYATPAWAGKSLKSWCTRARIYPQILLRRLLCFGHAD
jgi:hypothetical protein